GVGTAGPVLGRSARAGHPAPPPEPGAGSVRPSAGEEARRRRLCAPPAISHAGAARSSVARSRTRPGPTTYDGRPRGELGGRPASRPHQQSARRRVAVAVQSPWSFVGREPELGRIDEALDRAAGVVLVGDAGVGKTRL